MRGDNNTKLLLTLLVVCAIAYVLSHVWIVVAVER
jgi:hypothetical protein